MGRIIQNKPIEVILFDYDGVLVDSLKSIYSFYNYVCKKYGKDINMGFDEFKAWFPHDWRNGYKELSFSEEEIFSVVTSEFKNYMRNIHIPFYPGVEDVLEGLYNKGLKLGVVSTNHTELIKEKFDANRLGHCFETIVGGDAVEIKPSPEGILTALSNLDADGCNVLYMGDSAEDYVAVTRAKKKYDGKILFLFAAYGHCTRQRLAEGVESAGLEIPPIKVDNIEGVLPWVI